MFLIQTYELHDYWGYQESGSHTFSSSDITFHKIYDLDGIGDCEITVKLKSANTKGFGVDFRKYDDTSAMSYIRSCVANGANNRVINVYYADGSYYNSFPSPDVPYTANTDVACTIKRENNQLSAKVGNHSYTSNTFVSDLRYLGVMNWNNAKTVIWSDLIVKKL